MELHSSHSYQKVFDQPLPNVIAPTASGRVTIRESANSSRTPHATRHTPHATWPTSCPAADSPRHNPRNPVQAGPQQRHRSTQRVRHSAHRPVQQQWRMTDASKRTSSAHQQPTTLSTFVRQTSSPSCLYFAASTAGFIVATRLRREIK